MARKAIIVRARAEDIEPIAADMRPADAAEVLACSGRTPEQALRASWMASRWAFTVIGDVPVAMFGVADWGDGGGSPWLLATPRLLSDHRSDFAKGSRGVMFGMQESFTYLENYVDARNIDSVRWLRWLGFTIHPAAPHGVAGLPFHRFNWRR